MINEVMSEMSKDVLVGLSEVEVKEKLDAVVNPFVDLMTESKIFEDAFIAVLVSAGVAEDKARSVVLSMRIERTVELMDLSNTAWPPLSIYPIYEPDFKWPLEKFGPITYTQLGIVTSDAK